MEPRNVVQWNVVLFSLMGGASLLQVLLCAANMINTCAGVIVGRGFCHNQVCRFEPWSKSSLSRFRSLFPRFHRSRLL